MQGQAEEEQVEQGGGQGDVQPEDGVQVERLAHGRVDFYPCSSVVWVRW